HASSDVYVKAEPRPGIVVRETVISKPVYFGQKDLSAAGKTFGNDLVEKLVGDSLKAVREKATQQRNVLLAAVAAYEASESDAEEKDERSRELQDVAYRLEQLDKHGVKEKLEKQIAFGNDIKYCVGVEDLAGAWYR